MESNIEKNESNCNKTSITNSSTLPINFKEVKSRKRYRIQCWSEEESEKIKIVKKSFEDKSCQTEKPDEDSELKNTIQKIIFDNLKNIIEKNLDCGICKEIYLDSCILPCGHIFCSYCIRMWFLHADTCPICRITTEFVIGTKIIDNFLRDILNLIDEELVTTRDTMIVDRKSVLQKVETNWVMQNSTNFYSSPDMWQDWLASQTNPTEVLNLTQNNNRISVGNNNSFMTDERVINNLWPWDSDESYPRDEQEGIGISHEIIVSTNEEETPQP